MKKYTLISTIIVICIGVGVYIMLPNAGSKTAMKNESGTVELPEPRYDGKTSVEEAMLKRRSIRSYKNKPLTLTEVSQLLWAAQGITSTGGYRTAPSAGALYPLELYVVVGNVNVLSAGIYKYKPRGHELMKVAEGDKRIELCDAALGQTSIRDAAIVIVFSAVYKRITGKYGERGKDRYTPMEVGHAAQNVCLQAIALNLGTVVIGAFYDGKVKEVMGMPDEEAPLYMLPIGSI